MLSPGDEVLARGKVTSMDDIGLFVGGLGFSADEVVPLALVCALVQGVIAVGELYDVPGAWDAKEHAARILTSKARALVEVAPWLGEDE